MQELPQQDAIVTWPDGKPITVYVVGEPRKKEPPKEAKEDGATLPPTDLGVIGNTAGVVPEQPPTSSELRRSGSETTKTTIRGGADEIELRIRSGAAGTRVEDVAIVAVDAMASGGSSVAAVIEGASVELVRCELVAGIGADGEKGETPNAPVGPADPNDPAIKGAAAVGGRLLVAAGRRSREPFAVTCDGIVYVNIDALGLRDAASLKDRKLFTGAELGQRELRLARAVLEDAGHELGAKIAGARARRRRAAKSAAE